MKKDSYYWSFYLLLIFFIACGSSETKKTNNADESNAPTQWRGENRDGIYEGHGLLKEWPAEGPTLLWKIDGIGLGYSTPVIFKDKIYINGTIDSTSYLFALELNGNLLWKKAYGSEWVKTFPGVRSSPCIVGEHAYILSGLGELYCLQVEDGETVWKIDLYSEYGAQPTQHGMSENMVIDGDTLYCTPGGTVHNVIALNRFTGELIWSNPGKSEKNAYCNPIIANIGGSKILITMTDKSVISINAKSGELAWTYPLEGVKYGIHANTPYYRDGYLFVMDGFEIGAVMLKIAKDGKSAERVWKNEIMDETQGGCVIIGNNIYGSAETKKKLLCLDWETGEVKFELRKYAPGTIISADNNLYMYTYDGLLGLIIPTENGFVEKGSIKLDKKNEIHISHPLIHNDRLYIRYMDSLIVYDLRG